MRIAIYECTSMTTETKLRRRPGNPGKPAATRKRPLNVTFHPAVRRDIAKLAFKRGLSLSAMLEGLAKAELEKHAPTPSSTN